MTDDVLNITEAAELLGVSAATLRRWDRTGVFTAQRHPHNNYRVYSRHRIDARLADPSGSTTAQVKRPVLSPVPVPVSYGNVFVGRVDELSRVEDLIEHGARVITFLGPPGMGKTRLAYQVLTNLPAPIAGGLFVELTEAQGPEDVVRALQEVLSTAAGQPIKVENVERQLRSLGRAIVVLDNFEQVVEAAEPTVGRWSAAAPDLVFLVTSRERLNVAGEHLIELEPLTTHAAQDKPSEAARLFVQRSAQAAGRNLVHKAEMPLVEQVVAQLDGIPLAIELAASRATLIGAGQVLEQMQEHLDVFSDNTRVDRQATLRNAISWSWRLLSEPDQLILSQLSVFRGGFDLAAAAAVLELSADECLGRLSSLRDKSWIWLEVPKQFPTERRFRLFVSIRSFAAAALTESEAELAARRHAQYFTHPDRPWGTYDVNPGRLALERDNLMAVYNFAVMLEPSSTSLLWALDSILALEERLYDEAQQHLVMLVEKACRLWERYERFGDVTPLLGAKVARFYHLKSIGLRRSGDIGAALEAVEKAAEVAEAAGALRELGKALWTMGFLLKARKAYPEALNRADRALLIGVELGDLKMQVNALAAKSSIQIEQDDVEAAHHSLNRQLELCRELGDELLEAKTLITLAPTLQARGLFETASANLERALMLARSQSSLFAEGVLMACRASLRHEFGDLEGALADYDVALEITEAKQATNTVALSLAASGAVQAELGLAEQAEDTFLEVAEMLDRVSAHSMPTVLALHRAQLDVLKAEQAIAAQNHHTSTMYLAEARSQLIEAGLASDDDRSRLARSIDARYAARCLERRLLAVSALLESPRGTRLTVHVIGDWLEDQSGTRHPLKNRPSLQRILNRLIQERLRAPNRGLHRDVLVSAGWPGERILPVAAKQRLRTAIWQLRKMGLEGVLLSDDGYYLDPEILVFFAASDDRKPA